MNIIQAEFFLVKGKTLDGLLNDCFERQRDGVGIKSCVRFFEQGSTLTRLTLKYERLDKEAYELSQRIFQAEGFTWVFFCWRHRRLIRQLRRLRVRTIRETKAQLTDLLLSSALVARERACHEFTPLRKDEVHELLESIKPLDSCWLFVFKPNDLCAFKNEAVASLM